jgi:hypothetical protein
MVTFKKYITESDFDIDKFIESVKAQLKAFKDSENAEGEKFLSGILTSYDKNGSLSPAQVSASAKYMKN